MDLDRHPDPAVGLCRALGSIVRIESIDGQPPKRAEPIKAALVSVGVIDAPDLPSPGRLKHWTKPIFEDLGQPKDWSVPVVSVSEADAHPLVEPQRVKWRIVL